jgi:hypothetical protein
MSISGYFDRVKRTASMPESEPNAPDELAITCRGRVLNGRASVLEALKLDARAAGPGPAGPYGDLDPVLRDHICKK